MANLKLIAVKSVPTDGTSSVTFSSIPQTYTDLKILVSARDDRAQPLTDLSVRVGYNGTINTGSIYSSRRIWGNGSDTGSDTSGSIDYLYVGVANAATSTTNTFGNTEIYIPNYTSSNYKSVSADGVSENNNTTAWGMLRAGLISTTNPITDISISAVYGSGNFISGSTFYLYGISNVTTGSKATGGIVSYDSTYYYHMFPYSGTFTPTSAISADILCIAGGAAGGFDGGGGGGAGGIIYFASKSLTTTAYTIAVGAGGAGGGTTFGNAGSNSSFGGETVASGGGGGGSGNVNNSKAGGSGGGGGAQGSQVGNSSNQSSTGATAIYGNSGGTGSNSGSGGGGGGAGAAGVSSSSNSAGGAGTNAFSSWASATQTGVDNGYYAGGGGGGTGWGVPGGRGGIGGGGYGGGPNSVQPFAGIANTGGGGGGGNGNPATSASGGSGLVIIRYAI